MTVPEAWRSRSAYDLETARSMLEAGRYLYVFFCCQQAVEKELKAIIVEKTGDLPPRIHNLIDLADLAGIKADEAQNEVMLELINAYVRSRYPDKGDEMSAERGRARAAEILRKTEEVLIWLSNCDRR